MLGIGPIARLNSILCILVNQVTFLLYLDWNIKEKGKLIWFKRLRLIQHVCSWQHRVLKKVKWLVK